MYKKGYLSAKSMTLATKLVLKYESIVPRRKAISFSHTLSTFVAFVMWHRRSSVWETKSGNIGEHRTPIIYKPTLPYNPSLYPSFLPSFLTLTSIPPYIFSAFLSASFPLFINPIIVSFLPFFLPPSFYPSSLPSSIHPLFSFLRSSLPFFSYLFSLVLFLPFSLFLSHPFFYPFFPFFPPTLTVVDNDNDNDVVLQAPPFFSGSRPDHGDSQLRLADKRAVQQYWDSLELGKPVCWYLRPQTKK